jgi:hypothetical protein
MSMEHFADLFRAAGMQVAVDDSHIWLETEGHRFGVRIDTEWRAVIDTYFAQPQTSFDERSRRKVTDNSFEVQITRLDPLMYSRPDHEFVDDSGNSTKLSQASPEFCLALLQCGPTAQPMQAIKRRLSRRAESRAPRPDGSIRLYRMEDILLLVPTAKYTVSSPLNADRLAEVALKAIKASLFKLAYSLGECWELRESIRQPVALPSIRPEELDGKTPRAEYVDDVVKLYKVARSSIFPNQEFLSYYQVLEYYFLRVSDEILHTSVKSLINSPSFNASYENVSRLIRTLQKNDYSSDETEMLKAVLEKYVDEDDLIEYIRALEEEVGAKLYSDTKKKAFGEAASIRLEKGHALNNTARVIKRIRNALVHSSDKFNREECFLPLSEAEAVVMEYIPIVKLLAEKVIFATAKST